MLKEYEGKFLPSSDERIKKADSILKRLIQNNKDSIGESEEPQDWCTFIYPNEKVEAEYISSKRFILLSDSLVKLCDNEHQLAFVLANTLAHHLLKHKLEPVSFYHFRTFFSNYIINFVIISVNKLEPQ